MLYKIPEMSNSTKKIVLDCERMKYANTGLYHYCLNLGLALQHNLDIENESLYLYVRQKTNAAFNKDFNFINQHALHKFFMPMKKEYSVWHCTYQSSNYFPFTKKVPVVLTVHDLNFLYDEHKNEEKKTRYLKQHAAKIAAADYIVAISEFVMQDIQRNFDVQHKPCKVIYNGCNTALQLSNITPVTKQIDAPFIYTIGTVVDKKNFHVLPGLLKNNNRLLIISGITQSEAYKQKIIDEAIKHKVEDRVIFTGAISEAEKFWYMQNCECFVFPSLAEGFGLPVIEAMYFGKPVILSKLTSLPEIGGSAAYYFNNFDTANMQLVLDESLQHYKIHNPAEKIKARAAIFDWNIAAKEYLGVYRSLY